MKKISKRIKTAIDNDRDTNRARLSENEPQFVHKPSLLRRNSEIRQSLNVQANQRSKIRGHNNRIYYNNVEANENFSSEGISHFPVLRKNLTQSKKPTYRYAQQDIHQVLQGKLDEQKRITFNKIRGNSTKNIESRQVAQIDHSKFNKSPIRELKNSLLDASTLRNHNWKQAVVDLQEHNKNIMTETKRTIQDYETYIQALIESNVQLEGAVNQYWDYIQELQAEIEQLINSTKEREITLKDAIEQKIKLQKQLHRQSMHAKSQTQSKHKKDEIKNLKQQLIRKQKTIKMLQQIIPQKEQQIRKMSTFNNQMCEQIMQLKKAKAENFDSEAEHDIQVRWDKIDFQAEKNKIQKEYNQKIQQLTKQNFKLENVNNQYQRQIKNMMIQIQNMQSQIKKQMKKIDMQQSNGAKLLKRLQLLNKQSHKDDIQCSIKQIKSQKSIQQTNQKQKISLKLNDQSKSYRDATFRPNERYKSLDLSQHQNPRINQQQISEISTKQRQIFVNYQNIFDDAEQKSLMCQKVRGLMKMAYKILKQSKSNDIIISTITMLIKKLNQQSNQCQLFQTSQGQLLKSQDQDEPNHYQSNVMGNSFKNLKTKNQQIFQKIGKIRNRIQHHIPKIVQSHQYDDHLLPTHQNKNPRNANAHTSNINQHNYNYNHSAGVGLFKNLDITRSCDALINSKTMLQSLEREIKFNHIRGSKVYTQS